MRKDIVLSVLLNIFLKNGLIQALGTQCCFSKNAKIVESLAFQESTSEFLERLRQGVKRKNLKVWFCPSHVEARSHVEALRNTLS